MATRAARLPRINDRKVEVQQQLITFKMRGMGFLIPIDAVQRAIVFEHDCCPLRYINFQEDILPVVSIDRQIFNRIEEPDSPSHAQASRQQIALIITALSIPTTQQEHRITLPIDSPPSLCRLAESELLPLPKTYEIQCVDGMTTANAEQPLQFLLNPDQLVDSQATAQLSASRLATLRESETVVMAELLGI